MLTPVFELGCDHCHRGDIIKWPVGAEDVAQAWGIVEKQMSAAGWEQKRDQHKCPVCVAREKYPAQWTHEHNPDHVARLEEL